MQLKPDTQVVTADGKRVGAIDRVVLKPDTKEVTHVVVQKGFLFSEDKVVPLSLIGPATADKVTLRPDAGDLQELPNFEESYYIPVELGTHAKPESGPETRTLYWYPPVGTRWGPTGLDNYGPSPVPDTPRYILQMERNIPDGAVPIQEGARVIGSDGQHIGDIERIFTDGATERATHLLMSQGLILKQKKLIPTTWLESVFEDQVHLVVSSTFMDDLPEYQIED